MKKLDLIQDLKSQGSIELAYSNNGILLFVPFTENEELENFWVGATASVITKKEKEQPEDLYYLQQACNEANKLWLEVFDEADKDYHEELEAEKKSYNKDNACLSPKFDFMKYAEEVLFGIGGIKK